MTIAISNDFLLAFSNVQRNQQKQVREFIERFRAQPEAQGIHYERIQSAKGKGLFSVRINQAYRAIVYHPPDSGVYVLLWVDHHDEAYRWAERTVVEINPATGALQVVPVEVAAQAAPVQPVEDKAGIGLFEDIKDKHLLRLGIPDSLIPAVRRIQSDLELEASEEWLPQEAYEALFMLASGFTLDEVFDEVGKRDEEVSVDTADVETALANDDSRRRFYVVEEAKELVEILQAPLEQWRVFLHPLQRKLVSWQVNGPIRVLGGAGTGKTVVAMHRARFLAEEVFSGKTDRILFTTFTRNLAVDIQENLRKICSVEGLARIDVVNLDAWVSNFLRTQGYRPQVIFDEEGNSAWQEALVLAPPELGLSDAFYRSEWEQVIQAQNIAGLDQYLGAARIGRGTKLTRDAKKKIWPVFQEYRATLNEQGMKEFIDLMRDARSLIESRGLGPQYRAVVVDEAQDMSAEAFWLLRALAPEGPNDLFIVGDSHQRIYRHRASLGQCGINIKGRGRKLKINYRTTHEIRRLAVGVLEGRSFDDLDGGEDNQRGYMSLTHGQPPDIHSCKTFAQEVAYLKSRIEQLVQDGAPENTICVVARTNKIMESYAEALRKHGVSTYEIKRDKAEQRSQPGVRVATMHRVKGLEFDHVFVVSANAGIIPLEQAVQNAEDAVAQRNSETGEKCLLYVALTRAKQSATITGYGTLSPFIQNVGG